jgi:hypothetical protein
MQPDSPGHEARSLNSCPCTVLSTDKQKQAELVLQKALAKLNGCTALAAVEADVPVAVIENLTQEAVQRIDTAAGDVAACLEGTGTITCLVDVVSQKLHV